MRLPAAPAERRHGTPGVTSALLYISVATLTAVLLVPSYPQRQGALFASALALAAGLVAHPLHDAATGGGLKRLLAADRVLLVGIIYWLLLDLIQGIHVINASDEAILLALCSCGLFGAGVVLGTASSRGWLPRGVLALAELQPERSTLFGLNLACFGLGSFYYFYSADFSPGLVIDSLFRGRWEAPWSRGELGGWSAFIEHLSYFGYLMPGLTVLLAARERRWVTFRLLVSLACMAVFMLFLAQSGSRRLLGVFVGSGLITSTVTHRKRLTARHISLVLVLGLVTLISLNLMLAIRGSGLRRFSVDEFEMDAIRVDDNFLRLAQTIELVPTQHPHSGPQWLIHAFVRPVPRVLWPGKPTSPGFQIQEAVGAQGVSLTSSIVGEAYAAFGWLGILCTGLTLGWLAGSLNRLLVAPLGLAHSLVYALGVMALFAGERSLIELVLMSYPLLALWALHKFAGLETLRRRLRRAPAQPQVAPDSPPPSRTRRYNPRSSSPTRLHS